MLAQLDDPLILAPGDLLAAAVTGHDGCECGCSRLAVAASTFARPVLKFHSCSLAVPIHSGQAPAVAQIGSRPRRAGPRYLLACFHSDSSGLSTPPVVAALDRLARCFAGPPDSTGEMVRQRYAPPDSDCI